MYLLYFLERHKKLVEAERNVIAFSKHLCGAATGEILTSYSYILLLLLLSLS